MGVSCNLVLPTTVVFTASARRRWSSITPALPGIGLFRRPLAHRRDPQWRQQFADDLRRYAVSVGYIAFLGGLQGGTSATNIDLGPGSHQNLSNGFNFDVGYNNLNETFNGNFIDTNANPE